MPVPGEIRIAELGVTVRALTIAEDQARAATGSSLLSAALIGPELTVRNWRPGDRFWPAHSRSPEKHVPAEQRRRWPMLLHDAEIVWVRGFPVARNYEWKGADQAVSIEIA